MFKKSLSILRIISAFSLNFTLPGIGYFLYRKFKTGIILFIIYIILINKSSSGFLVLFMLIIAVSTLFLEKSYKQRKNKIDNITDQDNVTKQNNIRLNKQNEININDIVSVSLNIETPQGNFVENSKKLKNKTGKKSSMPYFETYWPTFRSMDKKQLNWYLYFRTEVEKGNYIDACLSYQFVYIYELINCSFISDWKESVRKLELFYKKYRYDYPKLDNYLPRWIGDMYIKHQDIDNAMKWFKELSDTTFINYFITRYNSNHQLDKMPIEYWNELCNVRSNKFNSIPENEKEINEHFLELLNFLNQQIEKEMDQTLLDYFNKKNNRTYKYTLFRSAVYEGTDQSVLDPYKEFIGHSKTQEVLNQLKRYVENQLRHKSGERKIKYKENVVPKRLRESLEDFRFKTIIEGEEVTGNKIPSPPKEESNLKEESKNQRKTIELNQEKIAITQQKQEELTEQLDKVLSSEQDLTKEKEVNININQKPNNTEQSLSDIFGGSSDDEIEELIELTPLENEIINLFAESKIVQKDKLESFIKNKGLFVNQVINQINEKLYDIINDALIEEDDNSWYCYEENYEEIIENIDL
ncbi:TerB N-terminal domain-containing protein [Orenia marismortui]|uniref:TerB-like protein n=1 Tax=Orenia marismortui TaxID=46469 RepID=A0A4R8H3N0_9FIRM|nr:TerB N-terminal domain-containing protein [Orenia marismortui]TDX49140.1 TerB-like protein [Orenia marismortui]